MGYHYDRTAQLAEAHKHGRFAQKASLQRAGTPTAQHNVSVTKSEPKKAAAKSAPAKKAAKKTVAKAAPAKTTAKKAAKKS